MPRHNEEDKLQFVCQLTSQSKYLGALENRKQANTDVGSLCRKRTQHNLYYKIL